MDVSVLLAYIFFNRKIRVQLQMNWLLIYRFETINKSPYMLLVEKDHYFLSNKIKCFIR